MCVSFSSAEPALFNDSPKEDDDYDDDAFRSSFNVPLSKQQQRARHEEATPAAHARELIAAGRCDVSNYSHHPPTPPRPCSFYKY